MQNLSPIKEQKDIVTKEYVDKIILTFIRQPSALANSQELQRMIDSVSANGGGRIRIPAGTYQFASTGKARNIDYCIRMKSNVEIYGDGATTILKPTGATQNGLDMFYFNDYRELNVANYLENCYFHDFAIDGIDTTSATYTTAGKGFMLNLMKNCRWDRVIVRNTDGTGIGVDCPIDCSINNCTTIGCGKACPDDALNGASGIGIGYGYSNDESMTICGCETINNKNWGIFYEHQRRFGATGRQLYTATANRGFRMFGCSGSMNNVNFGARDGINVSIYSCTSEKGRKHGYELHNCELSQIIGCKSNSEANASYAVLANDEDGENKEFKDITISSCMSKNCKVGVKIFKAYSLVPTLKRISILGNSIYAPSENAIYTYGEIDNLAIQGNASDSNKVEILSTGLNMKNEGNSWNLLNDDFIYWRGTKVPYTFKRVARNEIASVPIIDGQLLYDTDTGETWEDVGGKRIQTGRREVAVGKEEDTPTTKVHFGESYELNIPEMASDLTAVVPPELPASTKADIQSVLEALAANIKNMEDRGNWELIEKINVWGDQIISRNAEPDGTPYKFKAVAFKLKAGNGQQQVTFNVNKGNTLIMGSIQNFTAEKVYGYARIYQDHGWWALEDAVPSAYAHVFTELRAMGWKHIFAKSAANYPYIDNFSTSIPMVNGSIIEVWGIRA